MRQLATIRKITEIKPILDADQICAYRVGGWWVVDSLGKYEVGDLAVYCEIDSWIPHALAPFLSKGNEPRVYDGIAGERLRTIRLRGQLSQGLLLPANIGGICVLGLEVGMDVSAILSITKYEAPIPACLAGEVKGMFPSWLQKTDQERIQNLKEELAYWAKEQHAWEITEKLDGASMTAYLRDGEFGVCSRNLDLKPSETNSLWKVAVANDLELKLRRANRNIALQGELIGEGIQGNPYKSKGQDFFLFDIYNIDTNKYFTPAERKAFVDEFDIKHVPVLGTLTMDESTTIADLLMSAEGKSVMGMVGCEREGLVFKILDMQCSFKAISNKFLLKGGN